MNQENPNTMMARRFRSYLPVIVDVETAGFNPKTDALLEIAAIIPKFNRDNRLEIEETHSAHIKPFEGANLEPEALAFTGIDPYHPFRIARPEKDALQDIFRGIRHAIKKNNCTRAILVGHNAAFDLSFVNAAVERTEIKRNPFHPFSTFDTVTLCGLAYGQTVLAKSAKIAGLSWDTSEAHSALYDAEKTAEIFCSIVNDWDQWKSPIA